MMSLFSPDISKFPVIRVRQHYSYMYTLVPYKHTFLHNTSNLEHIFSVVSNAEFKSHVPRLRVSFNDQHAQFSHHSRMVNNGRYLGLIRATDICFVGYFYRIL